MVMDNNNADKREGVSPAYKKVKGFQPIHLYWGQFIVDAIFREGKAHSNPGNNVERIVVNAGPEKSKNLLPRKVSPTNPFLGGPGGFL